MDWTITNIIGCAFCVICAIFGPLFFLALGKSFDLTEKDLDEAFKDLPDIVINIRHEKEDNETEKDKSDDDYKSSYR